MIFVLPHLLVLHVETYDVEESVCPNHGSQSAFEKICLAMLAVQKWHTSNLIPK